ncbi:MAG: cysteine desulfurase/selenocysteine lyase [Alphaproteobacteria bacterium]|jgi:cysteine desulfurase/selenocysteine lyase
MSMTDRNLQMSGFDIQRVIEDFPILANKSRGKRLAFLDSAASAQKPQTVIDAVAEVYAHNYANVHRGVYQLSELATAAYEGVRAKVRGLINAESDNEIIFTSGTTDSINLVAQTFGRAMLNPGDEVLITGMEHHSNIVPWQQLRDGKGIILRVAPILDDGALDMDAFKNLLNDRTKLVAVTQVSNALGTVNPIAEMSRLAHAAGARLLVDGAQGIPHGSIDVRALDIDFYAFSGHKLYGPTGTGVLYAKAELLDTMPPWKGGGDMILSVTFDKTEYAPAPYKFEAGTPNIAGIIGMGAGIDWFLSLDREGLETHERDILDYGTARLSQQPGLRLIGTTADKTAVLSFVLDYAHPHDIGTILDGEGVAVRTGHHCAQPVMDRFDIAATVRASIGAYTTREDIDQLIAGLAKVREMFG